MAGMKVDLDYGIYTSGREKDVFCKTFEGNEYHNAVWPGVCAFADFTSPRTPAWWGSLFGPLLSNGLDGVWCDMNEPTVFVPDRATLPKDVAHRGDNEANCTSMSKSLRAADGARHL
jgi:alpha-glucosidase